MVRTLRRKFKISQRELAILAGVSMTAIQNWEAGKVTPRAEKKARLAALRKLGRTEVKKLLVQKASETPKGKKTRKRRGKHGKG